MKRKNSMLLRLRPEGANLEDKLENSLERGHLGRRGSARLTLFQRLRKKTPLRSLDQKKDSLEKKKVEGG